MQETSKKPALRFAGFNDAWEQRKLGEIVGIYDGVHQTPDYQDEGIMFLSVENISTLQSSKFITEEAFERDYKVFPEQGDILMTRIGDVGTPNVVETSEKVAFYVSLALLKPRGNVDSYYLCNAILSPLFQKGLRDRTLLTAIPQKINKDEIGKVEIFVPVCRDEQEAIGCFFKKLNKLITLHQRKYAKLMNIKKSMLDKMFPKDGATVPEIRFAGFTDAWEQREFGESFDLLTNNTLSRAELNDENGTALNVHYGDILVKFGEMIDLAADHLPYITDPAKVIKSAALQNGDVIIADTAEDSTVGKCSEITGIIDKIVVSGLHTIPCRPRQKFAPGYLGYFMNSPAYHDQLLPLMQGTKVTSVSKSALEDTLLCYPTDSDEQALIGRYFMNLDNLITLHQRELERLQNIKKSCLEKMFV